MKVRINVVLERQRLLDTDYAGANVNDLNIRIRQNGATIINDVVANLDGSTFRLADITKEHVNVAFKLLYQNANNATIELQLGSVPVASKFQFELKFELPGYYYYQNTFELYSYDTGINLQYSNASNGDITGLTNGDLIAQDREYANPIVRIDPVSLTPMLRPSGITDTTVTSNPEFIISLIPKQIYDDQNNLIVNDYRYGLTPRMIVLRDPQTNTVKIYDGLSNEYGRPEYVNTYKIIDSSNNVNVYTTPDVIENIAGELTIIRGVATADDKPMTYSAVQAKELVYKPIITHTINNQELDEVLVTDDVAVLKTFVDLTPVSKLWINDNEVLNIQGLISEYVIYKFNELTGTFTRIQGANFKHWWYSWQWSAFGAQSRIDFQPDNFEFTYILPDDGIYRYEFNDFIDFKLKNGLGETDAISTVKRYSQLTLGIECQSDFSDIGGDENEYRIIQPSSVTHNYTCHEALCEATTEAQVDVDFYIPVLSDITIGWYYVKTGLLYTGNLPYNSETVGYIKAEPLLEQTVYVDVANDILFTITHVDCSSFTITTTATNDENTVVVDIKRYDFETNELVQVENYPLTIHTTTEEQNTVINLSEVGLYEITINETKYSFLSVCKYNDCMLNLIKTISCLPCEDDNCRMNIYKDFNMFVTFRNMLYQLLAKQSNSMINYSNLIPILDSNVIIDINNVLQVLDNICDNCQGYFKRNLNCK